MFLLAEATLTLAAGEFGTKERMFWNQITNEADLVRKSRAFGTETSLKIVRYENAGFLERNKKTREELQRKREDLPGLVRHRGTILALLYVGEGN